MDNRNLITQSTTSAVLRKLIFADNPETARAVAHEIGRIAIEGLTAPVRYEVAENNQGAQLTFRVSEGACTGTTAPDVSPHRVNELKRALEVAEELLRLWKVFSSFGYATALLGGEDA